MISFRSFLILLAAASLARGQAISTTPSPAPHPEEPVSLENFVVSATPFKRDQTELAAATTVLTGRALALKSQPTLGETLDGEPGIAATVFSPGASRPVIRGLGGDRVRVLTNSVGTIDASVTSPDHAVAIEPFLAKRIEVVRGPATLLYGSNAVGGVVNVLDGRIPSELPAHAVTGRLEARGGSVADERTVAAAFDGAAGVIAWHMDGVRRETDDVAIPGFADPENPVNEGRLTNSAVETTSFAGGFSRVGKTGFAGASASRFETTYGVVAEEDVTIELTQRRLDLAAERTAPLGIFSGARAKIGFAEYAHTEFEGEEIGTRFENDGLEARVELLHEKLAGFEGAWGAQISRSDFTAIGDEAFLPPSVTENQALFLFEEWSAKPLAVQLGARVEKQTVETADGRARGDELLSASLGAVYTREGGYAFSASLTRTERAPNAQELFSNGPHAGTNAFEVGDAALAKEKSLGLDLGVRKTAGFVTGALSVFGNQFDRFIFEQFTGAQDPEEGLDVYQYVQRDVRFYGAELELLFHLHAGKEHALDLRVVADTVRVNERETDETLPRIAPRRVSLGLDYRTHHWSAGVAVRGIDRARALAPRETPTAGFALVSANVVYHFDAGRVAWEIFLRGNNLTDEEARNHGSFLKDIAPLPGRDLALGVRASF